MKKIIVLIFLITMSVQAGKPNRFNSLFKSNVDPKASNKQGKLIGGLSKGCQKMSGLALVFQQYKPVLDPAVTAYPWPVFAFGFSTQKSILYSICDFLTQVDKLTGMDALFLTRGFLNTMSDNKFSRAIDAQDAYWNLANSIYDFNGDGGFRKGALLSAATHRQIVDAADKTKKMINHSDEGIESKADRRRSIDELAKNAYEISILKDAVDCPSPSPTSKDKRNTYETIKNSTRERKSNALMFMRFYKRKLISMGKDAFTDLTLNKQFLDDLKRLENNSSVVDQKKVRYTPNGAKTKDQTGQAAVVNSFYIKRDMSILNEIKDEYVAKWESYVKVQALSNGLRGILIDKRGIIESQYRNYSIECGEPRIEPSIDTKISRTSQTYRDELRKQQEKCKRKIRYRDKDFSNLMDKYLTGFTLQIYKYRLAIVDIWNYEAVEFGINRNLRSGNKFTKANKVTCSKKLQPAEQEKLSLAIDVARIKTKDLIMKSKFKKTVRMQDKASADASESKSVDTLLSSKMAQGEAASESSDVIIPSVFTKK